MKKIVLLGLILWLFYGCVVSSNNQVEKVDEETLLANEKRTQAQPKEYHGDKFGVSITSDRKDTRTTDDVANNIPPKYEITNTVLFGHNTLWDGDLPYILDLGIKKIIKEDTGDLSFILLAKILTKKLVKFNDTQLVQIKLNNDVSLRFDCNVEYLPATNAGQEFHIINCTSEMSVKDVHTMRLHSGDANVLIKTAKNNFNFVLPKIFFTYLNEI